tara:strand:- start:785 stop:997 length:213 start_codon:yes stop_codon:yes gene_type:complete
MKKSFFYFFFLKVVTIGTKVILVVYQHLFAQICIFELDTIGYKRYNLEITVDYQGLFKQKYYYRYVPTLI